jgi:hypothetical protein
MKEQVFNLFYFAKAGFIEEIGVVAHQIDGTDAAKGALLQSLVETDYKICQRFPVPRRSNPSGTALPMSVESYIALERLGRHPELFKEIFAQFNAGANPLCCITPIVDGKPQIDVITDHSPMTLSKHQGHPKLGERVMRDYLEDYITREGFNLPSLINDDYFRAIKVLFNHKHYVSCMKLIASFIDTMAFLEYGDIQGNFILWLEDFADLTRLNITASQLWELRNSILHMSNLDSRKVLTGKERRIGFCIATRGSVSQVDPSIQYFNLLDLIDVLKDALSKWIQSINTDRDKFPLFIERYDTIISDAGQATVRRP